MKIEEPKFCDNFKVVELWNTVLKSIIGVLFYLKVNKKN